MLRYGKSQYKNHLISLLDVPFPAQYLNIKNIKIHIYEEICYKCKIILGDFSVFHLIYKIIKWTYHCF